MLTKAWPAFPADPVNVAAVMRAAGGPARAPIPVRVLADDAFTRDAMLACLLPRPEIRVLTSGDTGPARVVLVLSDQVTDETLERMRRAAFWVGSTAGAASTSSTSSRSIASTAAAAGSAESAPHEVGFVLIGDGLRAHHLLGAVAHGPLSVIARRDADTPP